MLAKLAALAPPGAPPLKRYIAFRYAPPLTGDALAAMAGDGVRRAVVFSQYPHFSCTTTGSSLNHVWREATRMGLEGAFAWSLIDRWPTHPTFVAAVARCVAVGLARFPAAVRDQVVIVFSAHSVPMLVVNRGDQYVPEVAATVAAVMDLLRSGRATMPVEGAAAPFPHAAVAAGAMPAGTTSVAGGGGGGGVAPARLPLDDGRRGAAVPPVKSPHILAWQSKVGFLPWMGPPSGASIAGLGRQGHKYVLFVPIAFTSDHIETLYEIDREYAEEAVAAGIVQFERAPSLNGEDALTTAQAQLVAEHLGWIPPAQPSLLAQQAGAAGEGLAPAAGGAGAPAGGGVQCPPVAVASPQYAINCPGCVNPACRTILNPAAPYSKLRDALADGGGCAAIPGSPWPSPAEVARLKGLKEAHP
jgi:ferrochelatase